MAARIVRNRGLRRLLTAFLAFNAGEYATWIAVLLFAYEETGPASVGVVAVLMLAPAAVFAPAVSGMGDRYPRDRVLAVGYLAYGFGLAVTAVAMVSGWPIAWVYAVAAVGGAPLAIVRPTQSALLPALCETPDELTSANGAAGIIEGAGIVIGPLFAAAILTQAGPPAVMAVSAIAVLSGAALVASTRPRSMNGPPISSPEAIVVTRPTEAVQGGSGTMLAGLRAVFADADARLVVGLMSARMLMIGAADVLFVLMALELLGMGEPGAGILNAALGAGTIVGGATAFVLVGRGRLASVAAAGACLWGLAFGLAGWLASPIVAVILIVAGGGGLAILDVSGRTILQRSVRDDVLTRVFGLQEGLAMAALAVGSIMVPALVGVFGLIGTILAIAGLLPLIVALAWSHLVALDARTPVPAQAIALLRRTELLALLPAPALEGVARHATWLSVATGTTVIAEGDVGDRYYVLSSGAVRVERNGRHLRDLADPGDAFGEIALLRNVPRTATVTATVDSVLLSVDRTSFLLAVTGDPKAGARADAIAAAAVM